jgi:hypothetical protein
MLILPALERAEAATLIIASGICTLHLERLAMQKRRKA